MSRSVSPGYLQIQEPQPTLINQSIRGISSNTKHARTCIAGKLAGKGGLTRRDTGITVWAIVKPATRGAKSTLSPAPERSAEQYFLSVQTRVYWKNPVLYRANFCGNDELGSLEKIKSQERWQCKKFERNQISTRFNARQLGPAPAPTSLKFPYSLSATVPGRFIAVARACLRALLTCLIPDIWRFVGSQGRDILVFLTPLRGSNAVYELVRTILHRTPMGLQPVQAAYEIRKRDGSSNAFIPEASHFVPPKVWVVFLASLDDFGSRDLL
ncbi:hypothetical protein F5146DRAFT_1121108 [Armillaria mellea]|nr:hypothetical protein F5146DRAFT_1121108 [Armillaria mellea]